MEFTPVNTEARKNLRMRSGDTVRVMQKIEEKGKTRLQPFEGIIISIKHGTEIGATFTVRRITGGYGVEKIFPLYTPMIDSIEIIKRSKVRRSKLYYIRETALKQIKKRMKMMFVSIKEEREAPKEEVPEEENTEAESNDISSKETLDEKTEAPVVEEGVVVSEEVKVETPEETPTEKEGEKKAE